MGAFLLYKTISLYGSMIAYIYRIYPIYVWESFNQGRHTCCAIYWCLASLAANIMTQQTASPSPVTSATDGEEKEAPQRRPKGQRRSSPPKMKNLHAESHSQLTNSQTLLYAGPVVVAVIIYVNLKKGNPWNRIDHGIYKYCGSGSESWIAHHFRMQQIIHAHACTPREAAGWSASSSVLPRCRTSCDERAIYNSLLRTGSGSSWGHGVQGAGRVDDWPCGVAHGARNGQVRRARARQAESRRGWWPGLFLRPAGRTPDGLPLAGGRARERDLLQTEMTMGLDPRFFMENSFIREWWWFFLAQM